METMQCVDNSYAAYFMLTYIPCLISFTHTEKWGTKLFSFWVEKANRDNRNDMDVASLRALLQILVLSNRLCIHRVQNT